MWLAVIQIMSQFFIDRNAKRSTTVQILGPIESWPNFIYLDCNISKEENKANQINRFKYLSFYVLYIEIRNYRQFYPT